jgi:hypothetical protein
MGINVNQENPEVFWHECIANLTPDPSPAKDIIKNLNSYWLERGLTRRGDFAPSLKFLSLFL